MKEFQTFHFVERAVFVAASPMSYDFYFFRPRPSEDPLQTARALFGEENEQLEASGDDAANRRIADALLAHDPTLEEFKMDYAGIAEEEGISAEEARARYRRIELNGPEISSAGIQISIDDPQASLIVTYSHDREAAKFVFEKIQGYAEVICDAGRLMIFDPQLERVLTPEEVGTAPLKMYGKGHAFTMDIATRPSRHWWKFLKFW